MANSKPADVVGARVIRALRQISGQDFDFFGYGGKWMEKQGFKSEFSIDNFQHKDFATFRKTRTFSQGVYYRYSELNLINTHFKRRGDSVLSRLNEAEYAKRIYQARPSLILSLDNQYVTWEIFSELNKYYHNNSVNKPQRQFYSRFVRDYRKWTEKYADHVFYTVPLPMVTSNYYQFPSQYLGQYGVYKAVRHIYQKTKASNDELLKQNSVMVNKSRFGAEIEQRKNAIRQKFRQQHQIPQDNFVIFLAPGNDREEVEFCLENLRQGVKQFLLKYSSPTSLSPIASPVQKFTTIISLHKGSDGEAYALQNIKQQEWFGNIKILSSDEQNNEHIDAMCASDVGYIYDGDLVGSAAVCHLPIAILIKMRMHHQWYHDLFNRWWSSMNIIADNNIYPEFIGGEAWFGKICDTLGQWYLHPQRRYDQVRKWQYFLKDAMIDNNRAQKAEGTTTNTSDIILSNGEEYDEFNDPMHVFSTKLWSNIQEYQDRFIEKRAKSQLTSQANRVQIPAIY